jgi:molybdenum cofactor cytidylyltransferase
VTAVAGILLAAGESRRMGGTNKLGLPIEGEPLLHRAARRLVESRLNEVVVVLGHDAERTERLLQDLQVRMVRNSAYAEGQMSSVHCGLAALVQPADGVMICLADQPLLTSADVDFVIEAFDRRTRGSILVPTYQGRRGNPIIIAVEHREEILNGERNLGCKRLIERNPHLVETVAMTDDHTVFDLDYPEDYAQVRERFERMRATR